MCSCYANIKLRRKRFKIWLAAFRHRVSQVCHEESTVYADGGDDNTLRATQNSTEYMNQVSGIRPKNSAGLGKSYRDTGYEIWLIPENRDSPSLVNRNHQFVNVYLYLKIHHE